MTPMTSLAAAILILQIVDKSLTMRLKQYEVNDALLQIDADNAADLAQAVKAVVAAASKVGDAIAEGIEDLLDGDSPSPVLS